MPRRPSSDMTPAQFRFYRDYLGLTQLDIADELGMSSVRPVAAWEAERNPSADAAEFIRAQLSEFNDRLTMALGSALPARTTPEGESVIELRRYHDDESLQNDHPEFRRVRHHDAHLRALMAVLTSRGIPVHIVS